MNIIGQESTSFNFDEIMSKGKIFLVKLGKGRFGSSVSALLANQLVSRFKHAAVTPFSFESVMDKTPYGLKIAKKVRDISRLKYGCDSELIKTKIELRRNIWKSADQ